MVSTTSSTKRTLGDPRWWQGYALSDLARQFASRAHTPERRFTEWMLLRYLYAMPLLQCYVGQISRYWGLETSAVFSVAKRLQQQGMIEKVPPDEISRRFERGELAEAGAGHRATFYRITPPGQALLVNDDPMWGIIERMQRLPDEDLRELMRILPHVIAAISHDQAVPAGPIDETRQGERRIAEQRAAIAELVTPAWLDKLEKAGAFHAELSAALTAKGFSVTGEELQRFVRAEFGTMQIAGIKREVRRRTVAEILDAAESLDQFYMRVKASLPDMRDNQVFALIADRPKTLGAYTALSSVQTDGRTRSGTRLTLDSDTIDTLIGELDAAGDPRASSAENVCRIWQARTGEEVDPEFVRSLLLKLYGTIKIREVFQRRRQRLVVETLKAAETLENFFEAARAVLPKRAKKSNAIISKLAIDAGPEAQEMLSKLALHPKA